MLGISYLTVYICKRYCNGMYNFEMIIDLDKVCDVHHIYQNEQYVIHQYDA